jgi:hypothetical protein
MTEQENRRSVWRAHHGSLERALDDMANGIRRLGAEISDCPLTSCTHAYALRSASRALGGSSEPTLDVLAEALAATIAEASGWHVRYGDERERRQGAEHDSYESERLLDEANDEAEQERWALGDALGVAPRPDLILDAVRRLVLQAGLPSAPKQDPARVESTSPTLWERLGSA